MAVTLSDLKSYIGEYETEYDTLLEAKLVEAGLLVSRFIGGVEVPEEIVDSAVIQVAAGLFDKRNAPNGIVREQYATPEGIGSMPMRLNKDPLSAVYPMLRQWVAPW